MSIVIIGKNSFLAQHVLQKSISENWISLSHVEALQNLDWIQKASIVINFSFAPQMQTDSYDPLYDIDSILAEKIEGHKHIRYIMLSSRMVYGQSQYDNHILKESQIPKPMTAFGLAKLRIEQSLMSSIGKDRLTILRLSNIFGFGPGRHTFFGTALKTLKEENKIVLSLAPESIRDFLAAWHFADMLIKIAANPAPGLYNIGGGFGIRCDKIAEWLIEGYGQGEIVQESTATSGQFWMDMSKTKKIFDVDLITPDKLRMDCLSCGYQLRKYNP